MRLENSFCRTKTKVSYYRKHYVSRNTGLDMTQGRSDHIRLQ